jgi:hypothetical protein
MNHSFMEWLEIITKFIVIIGVPVGVIQYIITKRKERRDREYLIYDAMDEKYIEFQKLCLDHPDLDVSDVPNTAPTVLNPAQQKEELVIFTILCSIFERAYLLYNDGSSTIKKEQWSGWYDYIKQYCQRNNFKQAWQKTGKTFDTNFQDFMKKMV